MMPRTACNGSGVWANTTLRILQNTISKLRIPVSIRLMASNTVRISITEKLDLYKLDSTFEDETTVHTICLLAGMQAPRRSMLSTRWKREKELGAGAFGVVWQEKEVASGELRAVKIIPRQKINEHEVLALIILQEVI